MEKKFNTKLYLILELLIYIVIIALIITLTWLI